MSFDFSQPSPAAADKFFPLAYEFLVESPFIEVPFHDDRREVGIDDELRHRGVAANVSLASRVQRLWIEHADHIAEVEIAVGDRFHITAADVTKVAFFTTRHGQAQFVSDSFQSKIGPM